MTLAAKGMGEAARDLRRVVDRLAEIHVSLRKGVALDEHVSRLLRHEPARDELRVPDRRYRDQHPNGAADSSRLR
jgi:hypothetical protein